MMWAKITCGVGMHLQWHKIQSSSISSCHSSCNSQWYWMGYDHDGTQWPYSLATSVRQGWKGHISQAAGGSQLLQTFLHVEWSYMADLAQWSDSSHDRGAPTESGFQGLSRGGHGHCTCTHHLRTRPRTGRRRTGRSARQWSWWRRL